MGESAFSIGQSRQDELNSLNFLIQQIEREDPSNLDRERRRKKPGRKARITLDVFNAEWEKRKAAIEGLESAFEVAKKKRDSKHDTKKAQEAAVKECESAGVELYKAKNNRN